MQPIKQINIPQPCNQKWQDMTEAQGGRHCDHCCKTVIDFTGMTNQQIIDHLSVAGNLCGRVNKIQLESINRELMYNPHRLFSWKGFSLAASLFFALPVAGAYAQHKAVVQRSAHKVLPAKKVLFKTVSGVIRDSIDKSTLPGVVIAVKGTAVHTVSAMDGKYSIDIPDNADTLAVNFTGYSPQYISIPPNNNVIDVALADCNRVKIVGYGSRKVTTITGAISVIVIKKAPFYKRWYYRFVKQPIKKIFG